MRNLFPLKKGLELQRTGIYRMLPLGCAPSQSLSLIPLLTSHTADTTHTCQRATHKRLLHLPALPGLKLFLGTQEAQGIGLEVWREPS